MVCVLSGQTNLGGNTQPVTHSYECFVCTCSLVCWPPVSSQRWFILQRMNNITPFLVVWSSLLSDNAIRQYGDTLRQDNELLLLSQLFHLTSRGMNLRAHFRVAVPPCTLQKGGHSQQVSVQPRSLLGSAWHSSHGTQEQRLALPPPCLLAQIQLQHAILKLNGSIHSPLWGCVPPKASHPAEVWGLVCSDRGTDSQGPKSCCVLLQTEKADRRQNFVSLALRKRYSYLTEPGMSELLLPKY